MGEAGDGANESAVEVEDDEVRQLTGEAAVTTFGLVYCSSTSNCPPRGRAAWHRPSQLYAHTHTLFPPTRTAVPDGLTLPRRPRS